MVANSKAHPGIYMDSDITQTYLIYWFVANLTEFDTDGMFVNSPHFLNYTHQNIYSCFQKLPGMTCEVSMF